MRHQSSRFGTYGINNQIGPYHYADGAIQNVEKAKPDGTIRRFKLVIAGAYNASGLIGSECNGILILDDENKLVILDEHARADSGYYGPTNKQVDEFEKLCKMNYEQFMIFCRSHPRSRTPELDLTPTHGAEKASRGSA